MLWALPTPRLLLIQAAAPIDPAHAIGYATTVRSGPVRDTYPTGQPVALSLICSPTISRGRGRGSLNDGVRRKRARPADEVPDWARTRCAFLDIEELTVEALPKTRGLKHAMRITITPFRVTVTGTVLDPNALTTAIHGGIGDGKAYGCALPLVTALP